MKTDLYTKSILTIIACCLLYIVARDLPLVQNTYAQSRGTVDVNIVQVAGRTFSPNDDMVSYGAYLPVKVK